MEGGEDLGDGPALEELDEYGRDLSAGPPEQLGLKLVGEIAY